MANIKQQQCETEYYHLDAMIDGRYRLTQFIGAGGMACVYRAKEEGSPHEFAIKFLKSEYHNMPYLIEYFRDEASSMRDLAHPNIVRFYRFVNNENYSYIIMDFVDGFALSEVIKLSTEKKDTMPLDEVARVMTQVARALDAIHREGYVHRDIKPSNVLIDRKTGRAFLTDLGITSASNTLMEGAGTMAYMSPEQAETWVADHRSDIYAYGIMLFEMLCSHRPFTVSKGLHGTMAEADLLRKHKEAEVPDITQYNHKLPKALNAVLRKGLAKKPEDRYQNIMDFARDIHDVLKPQLSADLQDFTQIKHRQIEAPVPVRDDSRLLRIVLAVGIIAILLAAFIFYDAAFNTPATATPVPTFTATVDPFAGESEIVLEQLQGLDALADRWDDTEIILPALDYEPLHYLQITSIEGFRVRFDVASADNLTAYGLAFRIQDAKNYHYFAVNPRTKSWKFVEVLDGTETTQKTGTVEELGNEWAVLGINRDGEYIFRVDMGGNELATYVSQDFESGSLALYVKGASGASLQLSKLEISLVGGTTGEATALQTNPSNEKADLLRHLRHDVEAIIATDNADQRIVNCPVLIDLYDSLDRHAYTRSSEVRSLVQQIEDDGAAIYSQCGFQPDGDFGFKPFYRNWEESLEATRAELSNSN